MSTEVIGLDVCTFGVVDEIFVLLGRGRDVCTVGVVYENRDQLDLEPDPKFANRIRIRILRTGSELRPRIRNCESDPDPNCEPGFLTRILDLENFCIVSFVLGKLPSFGYLDLENFRVCGGSLGTLKKHGVARFVLDESQWTQR